MALPTGPIESGLITRYRGDTTLQGLLGNPANPPGSVFDTGGVRTSQAFPYVVIFPITSQSGTGLVMGLDGVDTYMQVSVFTQTGADGGFAQARGIAARIYAITHTKTLDLSASGFSNFFLMFDNEQEIPEPDGLTQHIAHRYKLMVQG